MRTIADLVALITAASEAYYNSAAPIMTDAAFDALVDELRAQDPSHPVLASVGAGAVATDLPKVKHLIPMGSQSKARNPAEFWRWYHALPAAARQSGALLTWKMDGSSVALIYKKGKLVQAVTRGDGTEGNDITANAKHWKQVPSKIPVTTDVIVRGEAQLFVADWKAHVADAANPRNGGNGVIMRGTDPDMRNRHITFTAFDCVGVTAYDAATTQAEAIAVLASLGFTPIVGRLATTQAAVTAAYDAMLAERDALPFEVDGIVVYVNDRAAQAAMGASDGGTRPNGQVAWKFPPQEKDSIVKSITESVGRTGAICPVAVIEPVHVGGTTITNITLSSLGRVEELDLAVGDTVRVRRAGDVIPYIAAVVKRGKGRKAWNPTVCPSCGSTLKRDGAHIVCTNHDACPAQAAGTVASYISKMNILGIGDGVLDAMQQAGLLSHGIISLYQATVRELAALPVGNGNLGDTRATAIHTAIHATIGAVDVSTWLGSCGITHLGRRQADKILQALVIKAQKPVGLADVLACSAQDLQALPDAGLGSVKAVEIAAAMAKARSWLLALEKVVKPTMVQPMSASAAAAAAHAYAICLTGTMSRPRKDIAADIVAAGHRVLDDVSDGCTHLVQADPASQSSKSKKAAKKGIPVIGERDLAKLLASR